MGVWIEISQESTRTSCAKVTPYVGVWIEIHETYVDADSVNCHPLCGGVD